MGAPLGNYDGPSGGPPMRPLRFVLWVLLVLTVLVIGTLLTR